MDHKRVAVITGAANGIGRGLARIADERGMLVILADIDEAGMKETSSLLKSDPVCVPTDVSNEASVQALADRVFSEFKRVDYFFNNAGILRGGQSWEIPLSDWQAVLNINVMGVVNCIAKFIPRMIDTGEACQMINTASVGGFLASPLNAAYSASKFAVVALTEALAAELAAKESRVQVSLIAPGAVKTNIFNDTRAAKYSSDVSEGIAQMRNYTETAGHDPLEFARWVYEQLDEGKFWILGDSELFGPLINARNERILNGVHPASVQYAKSM